MRVLIVGSGGREHTIAWKLRQSPRLTGLYCAPGNAGTAGLGSNVPVSASDIDRLLEFAVAESVDLTVVGPEAPLVGGIVDRFREAGQSIAGPSAAASALEGSKAFAKDFMQRHSIPTARFRNFEDADEAEACLRNGEFQFPVVLKADGLAAGKGVLICANQQEALDAVGTIMRQRRFGPAGDRLVVEEFLTGDEASFIVATDGTRILQMAASQDHKAIYEGDLGPNTGGMGAYSDQEVLPAKLRERILQEVMRPTVDGMRAEGRPFSGILYAGLMLTSQGPKVLEFNARFGDPETQVILPLLKSDLLPVFEALSRDDLSGVELKWNPGAAVCVVLAAEGYPGSYAKGMKITGLTMAEEMPETYVFHAGTRLEEGNVVTDGGRVLAVTACAPSLASAVMRVYEGVNKIHFEGKYYRSDIAAKGLRTRVQ